MPRKRFIIVLIIFIILSPVIYRVFTASIDSYEAYQWQKKADAFMASLQEPFKKDIYGGKTPEETWAMYVDAVKKRDIELASKYVDVEHQNKRLTLLLSQMKKNNLSAYVEQISNLLKKDEYIPDFLKSNAERAYYYYEFFDPRLKEIMRVDVHFYLNPLTQVWKILY